METCETCGRPAQVTVVDHQFVPDPSGSGMSLMGSQTHYYCERHQRLGVVMGIEREYDDRLWVLRLVLLVIGLFFWPLLVVWAALGIYHLIRKAGI